MKVMIDLLYAQCCRSNPVPINGRRISPSLKLDLEVASLDINVLKSEYRNCLT